MKGKKCFGLLLVLFTIFGLLLNVSSDVNAVDFTVSVNPTGNHWETGTDLRCTQDVAGTISTIIANGYGECNDFDNSRSEIYLRNVYLNKNIPAVENNYYSFFLGFETVHTLQGVTWNLNTTSDWTIFEFKEVVADQMLDSCYSWASGSVNVPYVCQTYGRQWKSKYYQVTLKANRTGDLRVILGNMTGSPRSFMVVPTLGSPQLSMSSIFEFEPGAMEQMNEKDNEDRNNIESQQSDSQSGADDSQEDAESTGTTLLGAFTGFVTALTSASPSNCNIDMDLGNLDLGVVNLCQLSLPQPFPTIASIMLILFCVPLSISTARKVISLFRSFQG